MSKATAEELRLVTVTFEEYAEHEQSYDGVCLGCGQWTCGGCEPDAREYECEECGRLTVYGAAEALIMGKLDLEEC